MCLFALHMVLYHLVVEVFSYGRMSSLMVECVLSLGLDLATFPFVVHRLVPFFGVCSLTIECVLDSLTIERVLSLGLDLATSLCVVHRPVPPFGVYGVLRCPFPRSLHPPPVLDCERKEAGSTAIAEERGRGVGVG